MQGKAFGELTNAMAERANYGSAFLGYAHLLETNNLDASVEVLLVTRRDETLRTNQVAIFFKIS